MQLTCCSWSSVVFGVSSVVFGVSSVVFGVSSVVFGVAAVVLPSSRTPAIEHAPLLRHCVSPSAPLYCSYLTLWSLLNSKCYLVVNCSTDLHFAREFAISEAVVWLLSVSSSSLQGLELTLRRLMSNIYMEHPFLMFLDHTQRRSTVGRTPLDE